MQQYYKPPSAWRDQSHRRPRPPDILRVFSFRTLKFSKRAGPGERGEVSLSTQWRKVVLCILDNCTCVLLVKCVLEVLEWWCRAWHWHTYPPGPAHTSSTLLNNYLIKLLSSYLQNILDPVFVYRGDGFVFSWKLLSLLQFCWLFQLKVLVPSGVLWSSLAKTSLRVLSWSIIVAEALLPPPS